MLRWPAVNVVPPARGSLESAETFISEARGGMLSFPGFNGDHLWVRTWVQMKPYSVVFFWGNRQEAEISSFSHVPFLICNCFVGVVMVKMCNGLFHGSFFVFCFALPHCQQNWSLKWKYAHFLHSLSVEREDIRQCPNPFGHSVGSLFERVTNCCFPLCFECISCNSGLSRMHK